MLPNGAIQEVGRFATRELAELQRSILGERGIEAFVASDDCGGIYDGLTATQGARLLVSEQDLPRAREILAEHLA